MSPAQAGVIGLAAALYLFNLTVSGFANTYYAMAAQAASLDWSAWLFGSLDPANFITADKPPLATMLTGLSVRIFGLSSWSILVPQALAGVATVALLYGIVRRHFGAAAATIAGVVAALTPAAVVIFRYNNPDAILTLLLVAAAWTFFRGLEEGRLRWLVVSAVFVGLAFNTKFLQAYLVLPALALTYFVAGVGSAQRRTAHLVVALAVVAVSSGWWVAVIDLLPAADRPFIGGSSRNSAVDLAFGSLGLDRIAGSVGPEGRFGGTPGIGRMFNSRFGVQVAWLLPVAFVGLLVGLIAHGRARRTDPRRAAFIFWGIWLAVHALVFSLMSGKVHSYVAVSMAPAIGALVGCGAVTLWPHVGAEGRLGLFARLLWSAAVAGSGVLAWLLLARTPDFFPWLGPLVLAGGALGGLIIALRVKLLAVARIGEPAKRWVGIAGATLATVALLAGPTAYAIETIRTPFAGTDAQAGPLLSPPDAPALAISQEVISFLVANRGDATWIVAVRAARHGERIQLATSAPVMAIGGFSGNDTTLSVAQLEVYALEGKLRYVLLVDTDDPSSISEWVTEHAAVAIDVANGATVYDLTHLLT